MWWTTVYHSMEWYLHKIGTYDKKPWERSVDERLYEAIHGLQGFPKKSGKVKAELIDVDLVRGSPFTKVKPQISWINLACRGLWRLIFSPLHQKWWTQHTSFRFWILMQIVYVLQLTAIAVYWLEDGRCEPGVRLSHVLIPTVLWLVLGVLHSQIVSTHCAPDERNRTRRKKVGGKKRRKPKSLYSNKSTESLLTEDFVRSSLSHEREPKRSARSSDSDKASFEIRKDGPRLLKAQEKAISESSPFPSSEDSDGEVDSSSNDHRCLVRDRSPVIAAEKSHDLNDQPSEVEPEDSTESQDAQPDVGLIDLPLSDTNRAESESSTSRQLKQDSAVEADRPEHTEHRRSRPDSAGLRRRRRANLKLSIDTKALLKPDRRRIVCPSSCDSEADQARSGGHSMPSTSECDCGWDRVNSDMATSDTSLCLSGGTEISDDCDDQESGCHDDPFTWTQHSSSALHNSHTPANDRVSCYIWENNDCKKVDLTVLEIGATIIRRVQKIPDNADYLIIGFVFTVIIAILPILFQWFTHQDTVVAFTDLENLAGVIGQSWPSVVLNVNGVLQRFLLASLFFFLLSVAERTFKQRLWYAKHFCHLTSSRRARKYDLPHFRLKKIRNIRTWLSLRSFLKKCGPQRSIDVIVSTSFLLAVTLVALMCFLLLKDSDTFTECILNWELTCWCLALGIFLLRFMTLATKINKKYRNFSVLITEQINLYLRMEQKPHKKDDLMLTNNVLKLAEDLLKELESPFKISGLSADSFLYNATKVIILSAFSAVLTELLGFKLKLYKIKIKT